MSNQSTQEERIFEEALKRTSDAERAAFLDGACGNHPELRARLELLLEGHFQAEKFLGDRPVSVRSSADEAIGSFIGRYKLLEKIGEGGFGAVYAAEQKEPVKRRVALKIIKLGMDTRQVVARFEAERQALALMDHPNIARVFDGGATDTGRPYFVMELVRGVPLTKYCDENSLSVRERLALFMLVCHAVQHAHQKGIIHRDLKPSNILITVNDGAAVPKVIDFGVAKATQQELTEKTIFTQFHHFIGTPAYMSPEQAEMTSVDIDTRSDIYALGVLLYELLTGKPPFDGKELLASGLDEMRRIIRELEPFKPSTRLARELVAADVRRRTPGSDKESTSSRRRLQELRGDLDWIVMKCLEKDRNRRYETANGLAMDLERHLNNEPVIARPPSITYRFQKMVHRNKLAFAAVVTVAFALLAGIGATSWQVVRARRAEAQQRLERARAEKRLEATMRFFDEAFNKVSPALADVIGAARPRQQLANAAAAALDELHQGEQPKAASRRVLGQLYLQLAVSHGWFLGNTTGDYEKAEKAIAEAIRLFQSATDEPLDDQLVVNLAGAEMVAGLIAYGLLKFEESIEHHEKSYKWATRLGEQTTNSYFLTQSEIRKGWAKANLNDVRFRMNPSEEIITNTFLPGLELVQKRGVTHLSTNIADLWDLKGGYDSLGMAYYRFGRFQEALPCLREALRCIEAINTRRPHHAQFAGSLAVVRAELGEVLLCLKQPEEGFQLLKDATRQADDLAARDPANPGFAQIQIEVSWRSASGCIAWADDSTVSQTERRSRMERAEAYLSRAQTLLAALKSESLRRYLAADLDPVLKKAAKAKTNLGL